MSCTTCINTSGTPRSLGGFKIQQLSKYTEDKCNCGCDSQKEIDIFPVTVLQAITDACTNEKLDAILSKINHIFAPYRGNFKSTVFSVPERNRRQGLLLTMTNELGNIKTYIYTHRSVNEGQWCDPSNWKEVYVEDKCLIPSNLRIECDELKLDIVSQEGNLIDTLKTKLPINGEGFLTTKVVPKLPFVGKSSTIYLVKSSNKGTYNKYIWVDELKKFELLGDTNVSSGSCVVGNNTDTFIEDIAIENGSIRLIRNDGVVLESTIPNTEALEDIIKRIKALEDKEDKDTIFDPSNILDKINKLEGKDDKDTIFDPTSLTERIEALESKQDKDTIFDPSEILEKLRELEGRPTTNATSYDDAEIKRRLTALEQKQDKDTVYNDKPIIDRITALEGRQDNDTIFNPSELLTEIANLKKEIATLKAKPTVVDTDTNKFIISGEHILDLNVIRLKYNDNTTIDIPLKTIATPTPKKKVFFGHQEGYTTPEISITNIQEGVVEVETLPTELSFLNTLPIDPSGTHGYWGIAVDKELSPNKIPTLQIEFNGNWTNVLADAIKITTEMIEGKEYYVFRDISKNRNYNTQDKPFKVNIIL